MAYLCLFSHSLRCESHSVCIVGVLVIAVRWITKNCVRIIRQEVQQHHVKSYFFAESALAMYCGVLVAFSVERNQDKAFAETML